MTSSTGRVSASRPAGETPGSATTIHHHDSHAGAVGVGLHRLGGIHQRLPVLPHPVAGVVVGEQELAELERLIDAELPCDRLTAEVPANHAAPGLLRVCWWVSHG